MKQSRVWTVATVLGAGRWSWRLAVATVQGVVCCNGPGWHPYKYRGGQMEKARVNTGGRKWRGVGGHTSGGKARGKRSETIQEGGGGGA